MGGECISMRIAKEKKSIPSFFIMTAGFLLFWEWLRPLGQVTDTGHIPLLVLYAALCFLVSFFIQNGLWKFIIKGLSLLFILDYLFLPGIFLSSESIQFISQELSYNLSAVWDSQWYLMTPFFRSLLFLMVLWLMSYLLHYWFLVANKFFLFVVLTIMYLAVLDTFTSYEAEIAIVRTFAISFIALGLSRFMKFREQGVEVEIQKYSILKWIIPIIGGVLVTASIGIFAPKLAPQWPDPVPFIQSQANHVGFGNTVQKVGYGENDSQLGGSFVQDDTAVFEAISKERLYWRIESKDLYTGKGWERSSSLDYNPLQSGAVQWQAFSTQAVDTTEEEASVTYTKESNLDKVPIPYGATEVTTSYSALLFQDLESGMMEMEVSEQQGRSQPYTVQYEDPSFSIDQLKQVSDKDPSAIQNKYLQLPSSLPDRVRALAQEITTDKPTRYDKVKAIERYFSQNGYTYQIEDVSIPEAGEDYVDQFLFETMVGYCDNFSSSMVVMLRTLDIPARWVKGFTGGEIKSNQPDLPNGYKLYEITNNNAHSWVEVYFPNVGWVPFEPTSGFTNPTEFYQETVAEDMDSTNPEEQRIEETNPQQEQLEQQATDPADNEEDESALGSSRSSRINMPIKVMIVIGVILLVLLGGFSYWKRQEIRTWYLQKKWRKISEQLDIEECYHYLLKLLAKKGFNRNKGQTLRQYAKEVDETIGKSDMYDLTLLYEQYLYRNGQVEVDSSTLRNLFQRIVHQIIA